VNKPQGWTEGQKRKYFNEHIAISSIPDPKPNDNTVSFAAFMDKHYPDLKAINTDDPFVYALEEPYVDTTKIDPAKHWFRLMVSPVFRRPYCLTVQKEGEESTLITKITNGDGGFYTGTLALQMKFLFHDTLYNNLLRDLERLNFWSMPLHDTTCGHGVDGESWTMELIDNGRYHLVGRWFPEACGDSRTRQLAQIGLRIRTLSRLDKVLTAIGEEKSGR
jgi:hypothetical protein